MYLKKFMFIYCRSFKYFPDYAQNSADSELPKTTGYHVITRLDRVIQRDSHYLNYRLDDRVQALL